MGCAAPQQQACAMATFDDDLDLMARLDALDAPAKQQEQPKELPALDDLLQCFTAEGLFNSQHKSLLLGFLTADGKTALESLLQDKDQSTVSYILTILCINIFEE